MSRPDTIGSERHGRSAEKVQNVECLALIRCDQGGALGDRRAGHGDSDLIITITITITISITISITITITTPISD